MQITDSAIIASARLSQRYIPDRQLPDKAIDLVDEAASLIRMEIDSKPEEMDKLERRLIQLKIEQEALKKDDDAAAAKRKEKLAEDIAELEKDYSDLEEVWKAEKVSLQGAQSIKSSLEQARKDMDEAKRAGDLTRMSEIQYGVIPGLEKKLEAATEAETVEKKLLRHKVTEEEIADAEKLILPGVGAFDYGMSQLSAAPYYETLNKRVLEDKIPVLGICLGAQLLTEGSEEGELAGLGWIKGKTIKFREEKMDKNRELEI